MFGSLLRSGVCGIWGCKCRRRVRRYSVGGGGRERAPVKVGISDFADFAENEPRGLQNSPRGCPLAKAIFCQSLVPHKTLGLGSRKTFAGTRDIEIWSFKNLVLQTTSANSLYTSIFVGLRLLSKPVPLPLLEPSF